MASSKGEAGFCLKLKEFCDRIQVDDREVRYALARGIVPQGVEKAPGRGRHRQFNSRQAFWLALVLRLKAAGVKTPKAGEIAKWSQRLKASVDARGWDWRRSPFDGCLHTPSAWFLEVGDNEFVRLLMACDPARASSPDATDWMRMGAKSLDFSVLPIVVVRINLSELARLLLGERTLRQPSGATWLDAPADDSAEHLSSVRRRTTALPLERRRNRG